MADAPLTVVQVARILDRSRWTVLRRIQSGELASTQLDNGTHLIDPAELERYIEAQQERAS